MIHPHTKLQYINDVKGFGVVATHFIPRGTITWVADPLDREFTSSEVKAMHPLFTENLYKYCYRNNAGNYILCWDISRFINHSFVSNCISTAYNFELAVRDIFPGEELTDDYGYLNVEEDIFFPKEEGSDRDRVSPDDLLNYHQLWDAKLREAFGDFNSVSQPLFELLPKDILAKSREVAAGKAKMDSILSCYCSSHVPIKH
jgi:uncharacterized protein